MNKNQQDALEQLEAALKLCKHVGLAIVGVDSDLYATVYDGAFKAKSRVMSSCEAVLDRSNDDHGGTATVKTHGVYLDSGAT
ncbi:MULTISPECIES: hypothetical protein [Pseudomonas syringae group]|uniref:hypothetical protein n=1 Tax=Pseudomonas syringae group TaxID=136849 RepID=UPI000EFF85A2|nr:MULTISPECIES: hypothetical protein [Pseudomonas syringae group]MDH4602432.1 hypothetical protein [Pseudomonas syringae pv. papulans]